MQGRSTSGSICDDHSNLFTFSFTPKHEQHRAEPKQHYDADEPKYTKNREAVFSGGRIIVITIEQELFRRISDTALARLYDPQFHIFRRVVDPIEIARELAFRSCYHYSADVRELLRFLVPVIFETDG